MTPTTGLNLTADEQRWEIPGRVTWSQGASGMRSLLLSSPVSTAEIFLQGAHLTRFERRGEPPVLFASRQSRFQPGQPIRGGVPIIFPWFGNREGSPAHGFARTAAWRVIETFTQPLGNTCVRLACDITTHAGLPFSLVLAVSIGESLGMELITTNRSADQIFRVEDCLHTYFTVGAIESIRLHGLQGVQFLDKTDGFKEKTEPREPLAISAETDRVYQKTAGAVDILDPVLKRCIRVSKNGSQSTVVWNPWIEKARALSDFGDDEYHTMICVESGNVGTEAISLAPSSSHSLSVEISTRPL